MKFSIYQHFVALDPHFGWLALALGAAMVAGTWASRRLLERVSVERFRAFVTALLAAIGGFMLISGSR